MQCLWLLLGLHQLAGLRAVRVEPVHGLLVLERVHFQLAVGVLALLSRPHHALHLVRVDQSPQVRGLEHGPAEERETFAIVAVIAAVLGVEVSPGEIGRLIDQINGK